jgi:hypothetical protein
MQTYVLFPTWDQIWTPGTNSHKHLSTEKLKLSIQFWGTQPILDKSRVSTSYFKLKSQKAITDIFKTNMARPTHPRKRTRKPQYGVI